MLIFVWDFQPQKITTYPGYPNSMDVVFLLGFLVLWFLFLLWLCFALSDPPTTTTTSTHNPTTRTTHTKTTYHTKDKPTTKL